MGCTGTAAACVSPARRALRGARDRAGGGGAVAGRVPAAAPRGRLLFLRLGRSPLPGGAAGGRGLRETVRFCLEDGSRRALRAACVFLSRQRRSGRAPQPHADAPRGSVADTDVVALRFTCAGLLPT